MQASDRCKGSGDDLSRRAGSDNLTQERSKESILDSVSLAMPGLEIRRQTIIC